MPSKDLKRNFWHSFEIASPFLFLGLVVGVFFWQYFLKGLIPIPGDFIVGTYFPWLDYKWGYSVGVPVKNPILSDVVSFSFPMRTIGIDLMKNGQWPLWNPYILMGTPLLANFQSAPFSPTNIFYFLTDNLTAWSLQVITQHFLSAIFTYTLLRHWKISKLSALLGGIIFAFSGFNLIWSQWNAHVLVAAFIPFLVFLADKFLETRRLVFGVGVSVVLALQIISGYPQVVLYSMLAICIIWLLNLRTTQGFFTKTVLLGLFGILGVSLASFQIFPGFELLKLSQRSLEPHPFEWAFLPFAKIITFLAPDFYGNHATGNYWGPLNYVSNTGFVGAGAFLLSFFSLRKLLITKKSTLFGLSLVASSLFLSFPTLISIFLWKNGVLGLNASAGDRALVLFNLGIAILAGIGLDQIDAKVRGFLVRITVPVIILLGFGLYALNIQNTVALRNLVLPVGFFLLSVVLLKLKFRLGILLLIIIELFLFGWKFTPFSPRDLVFPKTPVISFLKEQKIPFRTTGAAMPTNFRMVYGLESVEGYDAIYPADAARFIREVNGNTGELRRYAIVDNDTSELLNIVNTKYNIALKNDPQIGRFTTPRYKKIFEDKSVVVFENSSSFPRALLVHQNIPAEYRIYTATKSALEVQSSIDDKLLVSDSWYPGWKAYIDGREVSVEKFEGNFRLVNIPAGKHTVEFVYKPESFFSGLRISLFSLSILLGLVVFELLNKNKYTNYT